jgi:hypothetical protein
VGVEAADQMTADRKKELHEYSPILALTWRLIRVFPSVRRAQDRKRAEEEKK